MNRIYSIAIETSCRVAGLAIGQDDRILARTTFEAAGRHSAQLVLRMDELLTAEGLQPADLHEAYVSSGPGSFTGLRVGITVARTLAQALPNLRCVAVATADAVAHAAEALEWDHLGVIMDAREGTIFATLYDKQDGRAVPSGPGRTWTTEHFLAETPRPILLLGEGLAYEPMAAPNVTPIEPERTDLHLPTPEAIWQVGRDMARAGRFADPTTLLPLYARRPEAVRLWEQRHGPGPDR